MASLIWNFFSSLYDYILEQLGFREKEGKIVIVGLDNAGKTTLLHRLSGGSFQPFPPTRRAIEETVRIGNVTLKAWDLGGHEAVRHLWTETSEGADGIIFVLDSADQTRFAEAADELLLLLTEVNQACELRGADPPTCAILFNKIDLRGALSTERVSEALDLQGLSNQVNPPPDNLGIQIQVFPCSVLRGEGYLKAFRWIASQI